MQEASSPLLAQEVHGVWRSHFNFRLRQSVQASKSRFLLIVRLCADSIVHTLCCYHHNVTARRQINLRALKVQPLSRLVLKSQSVQYTYPTSRTKDPSGLKVSTSRPPRKMFTYHWHGAANMRTFQKYYQSFFHIIHHIILVTCILISSTRLYE